ncbi:unnamed protein product [Diamesa tonsa]
MDFKYLVTLFLLVSVISLINSECPEECKCETKPENETILVVDCSNQTTMTEILELPSFNNTKYIGIELNIQNNNFTTLPLSNTTLGYDNVIMINATRNRIDLMFLDNIPANLKVLDLTHNNLTVITTDIQKLLKQNNVRTYIAGNPWVKMCSSNEFRKSNTDSETFVDNSVICKTEIDVEKDTLAKNKYIVHVIILVLACIVMFLIGIFFIWKFCQKFGEQSYSL